MRGDVRVVALHPASMVNTDIARSSWLYTVGLWLASPFTLSPAQAASQTVYCVAAGDVVSGGYYQYLRRKPINTLAEDAALRAALWARSEALIAGQPQRLPSFLSRLRLNRMANAAAAGSRPHSNEPVVREVLADLSSTQ